LSRVIGCYDCGIFLGLSQYLQADIGFEIGHDLLIFSGSYNLVIQYDGRKTRKQKKSVERNKLINNDGRYLRSLLLSGAELPS
jgi:hypothetical protein